jgi:hypothetical protein
MSQRVCTTVILSFIVVLACLSGCKKDSTTNWDAGVLAPLAKTSLSINNLIKDSILQTNTDNSLTLSYQNNVYELNLADQYIHIPDTSIGQKITVDSLSLPNIHFDYNATLGSIATNLIANGQGFLGRFIIDSNGHNTVIPPLSNLPINPFTLNASSYFQNITLSSGLLELFIYNNLPIPIQNISFEVRNNVSNTILLSDNISNMPPFSNSYRRYDLGGKTIENQLTLKITSFSSAGSGGSPVLLDTSNSLSIHGDISQIKASSAIAVFPAGDIVSSNQEITQDIGSRRFTYVDCKEGKLDVEITSAIKQPLRLTYKLIGAYDKNGRPLTAVSNIAAATNNSFGTVTQSYDLAGYAINLTGSDGTKFNTYTQIVVAHIDSTGVQTQITNSDSINIKYKIRSIRPNYIKGYAGRDTVSYQGSTPFSIASILNGNQPGAIQFDKAGISVSIVNGLGVEGQVVINKLEGVNANGNAVSLVDNSTTPVIGRRLAISKATDFPLTPKTSTFTINSATSNISDFIGNLPEKINYDVTIYTNQNGNRGTYDDFAYLESRMKVNLDVNIPLSVAANDLKLRDSFDFSLGYSQKDVENIKDGVLHLLLYNKFPIQADITLVAYDSSWNLLDTLASGARVEAADIVSSSCKAEQSKKSVINITASAARIDRLRAAKHAVLTVVFNTKTNNTTCNGQFVKIYNDYTIDAKITADFTYKIKL